MRSCFKLIVYLIFLQISSLHVGFKTLADSPKNYLKGKFYKTIENNFLVATEKMNDSRFKKTVIIILDNDETGSWGLVVNKPLGSIPLKFLINTSKDSNEKSKELYEVNIPIFWGGPVDEKQIYILHSSEYKNETTKKYKGISVTRDRKILFDIAENKGPKKSLVVLGYSGWGDGQLEGEMEMEHWILSEISQKIIFEKKSENKWIQAFESSFIRL